MTDETPTPESTPYTKTPAGTTASTASTASTAPPPDAKPSVTAKLTAGLAAAWADKKKRKYFVIGAFVVVIVLLAIFGPDSPTMPAAISPLQP